MRHLFVRCLTGLSVSFVLAGCPGTGQDTQEHPCKTENHCIYNNATNESECEEGYAWEDVNDSSNYNCVLDNVGCPENSSLDAEETCQCDEGYVWNADNTLCIETPDCPEDRIYQNGDCVCPENTVELDDGSCADTTGCPPNSYRVDDETCRCVTGYTVNAAGTACVLPEDSCPPNATWNASTERCVCDEGYTANSTGDACVEIEPCPENSTRQADNSCTCDEGYVLNDDGDACVLPEDECPDGRGSVIIDGEVIICCPEGATVVWDNGNVSCNCPGEQVWDSEENTCEGDLCAQDHIEVDGECVCPDNEFENSAPGCCRC